MLITIKKLFLKYKAYILYVFLAYVLRLLMLLYIFFVHIYGICLLLQELYLHGLRQFFLRMLRIKYLFLKVKPERLHRC